MNQLLAHIILLPVRHASCATLLPTAAAWINESARRLSTTCAVR